MYRYQIPIGVSAQTIQRKCSFLKLFEDFAKKMHAAQGLQYDSATAIADNELVEMWISEIANEDTGKTRPGSARGAINTKRLIMNIPPLPVGGVITNTCASAMRSAASATKQTLSIHVDRVRQITIVYAPSQIWHRRQIALMTTLGFLALLRLGEVRLMLKLGVILVLHSLHEVTACHQQSPGVISVIQSLPRPDAVRALQLCIGPRKTSKHRGSWITISDPTLCSMMVVHLYYLRSVQHTGKFLFPSREHRAGTWQPHPHNPKSRASYVGLMRLKLHDVGDIS